MVQFLIYALISAYQLLIDNSFKCDAYWGAGISLLFGIPNYFLVFKDDKFMKYFHQRLLTIYVLLIIVGILALSLTLLGLAGQKCPAWTCGANMTKSKITKKKQPMIC